MASGDNGSGNTTKLILQLIDIDNPNNYQNHEVVWFNNSSRDFIARMISWAARNRKFVVIFDQKDEDDVVDLV
jgi:hypothetical protein